MSTPDDCPHCASPYENTKVPLPKTACACGRPFFVGKGRRSDGPPEHTLFALEYHCAACKIRTGPVVAASSRAPMPRTTRGFPPARARKRFAAIESPFWPKDPIPPGDETNRLLRWGYRRFRDLHNERQLLGLANPCRSHLPGRPQKLQPALATVYSDFIRYQNMELLRHRHRRAEGPRRLLRTRLSSPSSAMRGRAHRAYRGLGSGGYRHFLAKYAAAKRSLL